MADFQTDSRMLVNKHMNVCISPWCQPVQNPDQPHATQVSSKTCESGILRFAERFPNKFLARNGSRAKLYLLSVPFGDTRPRRRGRKLRGCQEGSDVVWRRGDGQDCLLRKTCQGLSLQKVLALGMPSRVLVRSRCVAAHSVNEAAETYVVLHATRACCTIK